MPAWQAVLFDLDGTLVDTAPDLVASMMALRVRAGLAELAPEAFRYHASRGAAGLLEAGFAGHQDVDPLALRADFLVHYQQHLWVRSRPFRGIEPMLDSLAAAGSMLGIVTNKPGYLTSRLLSEAGWSDRFGCVIAGDTLAESKPHPAPVLEACRRLGVDPACCLFVGDDRRDVDAGRAAGVTTALAAWGYLPPDDDGRQWGADLCFGSPEEIIGAFVGDFIE